VLAGGAVTPVDNLGFVDDEPVVLGGLQAWPMPYRAIYVCRAATGPANDVVVIVIDPVFVPGRRTRRLDTPDEAIVGQNAQGVVHRLTRHSSDISPNDLFDLVRGAVRPGGHRPQNGQTLSRYLNAVLAKEVGRDRGYFPEHKLDSYSDSGLCQVSPVYRWSEPLPPHTGGVGPLDTTWPHLLGRPHHLSSP
jgi:hypothetical protein